LGELKHFTRRPNEGELEEKEKDEKGGRRRLNADSDDA